MDRTHGAGDRNRKGGKPLAIKTHTKITKSLAPCSSKLLKEAQGK